MGVVACALVGVVWLGAGHVGRAGQAGEPPATARRLRRGGRHQSALVSWQNRSLEMKKDVILNKVGWFIVMAAKTA